MFGVVELVEVVVNFGGGMEVVVVGYGEIGEGGGVFGVDGSGEVEMGCRGGSWPA